MPRRTRDPSNTPSSSLSREGSLPRKEPAFRGSTLAHPPPTTVWGARGRLFPHRRPCRWVDLKQPHRRVFTDFLGGRARPFKRFCPPLTRYPHSDLPHPPSRFWCAENSHLQSFLGWQSGDASGFLPLLHVPPSPAACMIGDTFGFLPQPTSPVPATLQSMNKDAKDFPSWWTKSPPRTLSTCQHRYVFQNTTLSILYSISFPNGNVNQGYRLGFSAQFGPATHFSLAAIPPLQRGSQDSSKQRLKGFCATAGMFLPPPQRGNRGSPSIGPGTRLFQPLFPCAKKGRRFTTHSRSASSEPFPLQREVQDVDAEDYYVSDSSGRLVCHCQPEKCQFPHSGCESSCHPRCGSRSWFPFYIGPPGRFRSGRTCSLSFRARSGTLNPRSGSCGYGSSRATGFDV